MVSITDSMDINPANSGRKWRTEEPDRLHSMGLQRVGHDCCTTTNSEILLSHFGVAYTGLLCMCAQSVRHVPLFVTPWTLACQAPLSMRFSRQECWSGLPSPSPQDLPDPRIEPMSFMSPALAGGFFTTITTWETHTGLLQHKYS